ncbi:hypothetical protein SISNIDRAFT_491247 [Sistotremastrum niveocremeum HHB9708]|uniref:Uncharacterized protein n=1 Tax=Sistotremastrum niveocremeum HHB9708 TaxID=1314777 RepID=A0A164MYQ2_9AGAM|nr:hypothetical protein SISNIDRAFT_491247 [Sistotremastrum niveocremeum HHB9708]
MSDPKSAHNELRNALQEAQRTQLSFATKKFRDAEFAFGTSPQTIHYYTTPDGKNAVTLRAETEIKYQGDQMLEDWKASPNGHLIDNLPKTVAFSDAFLVDRFAVLEETVNDLVENIWEFLPHSMVYQCINLIIDPNATIRRGFGQSVRDQIIDHMERRYRNPDTSSEFDSGSASGSTSDRSSSDISLFSVPGTSKALAEILRSNNTNAVRDYAADYNHAQDHMDDPDEEMDNTFYADDETEQGAAEESDQEMDADY